MAQHAGDKRRDNFEEEGPERVQHRYVDEFEQVHGGPHPKAGVKERAAATGVL